MNSPNLPITFINGEIVNSISVADRGLAYGDGLFETILISNGQPHLWSYHHARLLKGLNVLQIAVETQRLRNDIDRVIENLPDSDNEHYVLKLIITRGESGRGYQPTESRANIIITLSEFFHQEDKYNGVATHLCKQKLPLDSAWAGLKTLNQLSYVLASLERKNKDFDEGILLSTEDHLIEATSRNIFLVNNEVLYTPKLNRAGVDGVLKTYLLDKIIPQLGFECIERDLNLDDLLHADEVFLTNSVTGIWPVLSFEVTEGEKSQWPVGAITRSLQSMSQPFV
jgi:4-amino-4-deoxychorismate lyase